MHCLSCGYDLSKHSEHRCPECGRLFDPNNRLTFDTGTSTAYVPISHIGAIAGISLAAAFIYIRLMMGKYFLAPVIAFVAIWPFVILMMAYGMYRYLRRQGKFKD